MSAYTVSIHNRLIKCSWTLVHQHDRLAVERTLSDHQHILFHGFRDNLDLQSALHNNIHNEDGEYLSCNDAEQNE